MKKKIEILGDSKYEKMNAILFYVLYWSIIFSLLDKYIGIIKWPDSYSDEAGVMISTIGAIIIFVASIIGIAISLQSEEVYGVKTTKLYALRVKRHFTILQIIVMSILLCCGNLFFYMVDMYISVFAVSVISIVFLLYVAVDEIPIMAKNEKAILQILKDNFIYCYNEKKEAPKDFKDAIKYLLYKKNLKEIYENFKYDSNNVYNKHLLMKLLEYQQDLAFELEDKTIDEQLIIGSSLLKNVFDVINRYIEFTDETYNEIQKNSYLLTRVLFRISKINSDRNPLIQEVPNLVQSLSFASEDTEKIDDLMLNILITLTTISVKDGDFRILKSIRYQFSHFAHGLKEKNRASMLFAVISLHLYYLYYSDSDVPENLKNEIFKFVNEKNIVENQTLISSWKRLFNKFSERFDLNYDEFVETIMKHEHDLEYWLFGKGAKSIVLNPMYVTNWYLTNLITSKVIHLMDYKKVLSSSDLKDYLIRFTNGCFDENMNFVPTDNMKKIVNFYNDSHNQFMYFEIRERNSNPWFKYVNELKTEELRKEISLVEQINNEEFANNIKQSLENVIKNEWGYDSSIKIEDQNRYFSALLEIHPNAINYEDSIIDFVIRSVLHDIEKSIMKTTIYKDDDFEGMISQFLDKNVKYKIGDISDLMNENFIPKTTCLYKKTENIYEEWESVTSRLLNSICLVKENGFKFNCIVDEVFFKPLNSEQLSEKVSKYQREDGQFVFEGVFLPKEEITDIIKNKFTILNFSISYQVISSEDTVLAFEPYMSRKEDE